MYLISLCYHPPDPSLTCSRVLATLDSVNGSDYLENCLQIPQKIREEMRRQSSSAIINRKKLVKYWLTYHPNASWEYLAGKLLFRTRNQAVEKVKKNIFRPRKGINTFWCYCKQVAITQKRIFFKCVLFQSLHTTSY